MCPTLKLVQLHLEEGRKYLLNPYYTIFDVIASLCKDGDHFTVMTSAQSFSLEIIAAALIAKL